MSKRLSLEQRRAIIEFSPDTSPVSVRDFCKQLGVSRATFYRIRELHEKSSKGAWVPRSTAPHSRPRAVDDNTRELIISARKQLAADGMDCGSISIFYMLADGPLAPPRPVPSESTIYRVLKDAELVERNRRKRPRSSYTRFARAYADELWQIDALTCRLWGDDGQRVTIYQIIDDASRFDVGTKAFTRNENAYDAITALQCAFAEYGVPKQLLSDNGTAFNQLRSGVIGVTERFVISHGCEPISGLPGKPTTQGKNERAHQPLRRFLNAHQPTTFEELEELIQTWRHKYNHERRHQGFTPPRTPADVREELTPLPRPIPPVDENALAERIQRYTGSYNRYNTKSQHPGEYISFTTRPGINVDGHAISLPGKFAGNQFRIHRTDEVITVYHPDTDELVLKIPRPIPKDLPRHVSLARVPNAWSLYKTRAYTGQSPYDSRVGRERVIPQEPTLVTVKNGRINVQGHKVTVSSQFNGQKLLRIIDDTNYTLVEQNTKEVLLTIPLPLGEDIPRSVALHQIPGAHAKWEARSYRKKQT